MKKKVCLFIVFCNFFILASGQEDYIQISANEVINIDYRLEKIIERHLRVTRCRGYINPKNKMVIICIMPVPLTMYGIDSKIVDSLYSDNNFENFTSSSPFYDILVTTNHVSDGIFNSVSLYKYKYYYKYRKWNILFVSDLNIKLEATNTVKNLIVCDKRKFRKQKNFNNNQTGYEIWHYVVSEVKYKTLISPEIKNRDY